MRRLLVFILCFCAAFATEDIGGFWKSLNDQGNPQCIFGIYEHQGVYYGRIIGTYDDDGVMRDTIYKPSSRSAGVAGNPYTCGLDIIYGLVDNGYRYAGKILDPTKGNVYNCEVWPSVGQLTVRGKLLIFGKNITWYAADKSDFPKGFKLPEMSQFVPSIPQAN